MTTFFAFKTRFRSEQEMLMNEKNKEMERWASVTTLLSSILLFVFVCLLMFFFSKRSCGTIFGNAFWEMCKRRIMTFTENPLCYCIAIVFWDYIPALGIAPNVYNWKFSLRVQCPPREQLYSFLHAISHLQFLLQGVRKNIVIRTFLFFFFSAQNSSHGWWITAPLFIVRNHCKIKIELDFIRATCHSVATKFCVTSVSF